jgi:hypothetical protein
MNIVNDLFAELVAPSTPGAAKERGGVGCDVYFMHSLTPLQTNSTTTRELVD